MSKPSDTRISLRLWVFKFVDKDDEPIGVCVEGYRPNDDTETVLRNWHSTVIEKRVTSSLLMTRSGRMYELRGSIDRDLAILYGYPIQLIDSFTNGFPENWKSILQEYSYLRKPRNSLNSSHCTNLSEIARRLSSEATRVPKPFHSHLSVTVRSNKPATPIVEEEEPDQSRSSVANDATTEKEEESLIDQTPDNTYNSQKSLNEQDRIVTRAFLFSPEKTFNDLEKSRDSTRSLSKRTRGKQEQSMDESKENDEKHGFSPFGEPHRRCGQEASDISESRIENRNDLALAPIQSSRINHYEQGDDAVELRDWSIRFTPFVNDGISLGFPKFVLRGTKRNHPTRWQSSIVVRVESATALYTSSTKYRLVGEIDIRDCAEAGFPKTFIAKFLFGFPPDWRTTITMLFNTIFSHLDPLVYRTNTSDNDMDVVPCRQQNFGPPHNAHRNHPGAPNEGALVVREVRRSRSGRCVRAPLAEWAGQRVRYDGAGNVLGVEGVNCSTVHSTTAPDTLELSNYYGVSPPTSPRQRERFRVPAVAAERGGKKFDVRKDLVTFSDNSDYDDEQPKRKRLNSSDDCYGPGHSRRPKQIAWHETDIEREIKEQRRLILQKEKELRKQQKELEKQQKEFEAIKRRISEQERRWKQEIRRERILQERNAYYSDEPEHVEKKPAKSKQHKSRQPYQLDDVERTYRKMSEMERRRFEEEWAREDEQYMDESDNVIDDSWCEPVRKKTKKKPQRRVRIETDSSAGSYSTDSKDEDEEEDEEESGDEKRPRAKQRRPQPVVQKEKGWRKDELHRLKLALAAIRVVTDDDWEKVARSLGGSRKPEACKEAAIKRLKWEPPVGGVDSPQVTAEAVTARPGTIAYQHQTNEYTRKFLMGAGARGEDFFNEKNISDVESIPDVADFGADDSLLEAIRTPVDAVLQKKVSTNRRQFFVEPMDDDTPLRRRSSAGLLQTPIDSAQRERHDRYYHHLLNKKGQRNDLSRVNYSRFGNCTRNETFADGYATRNAETFLGFHDDLDGVTKMARKAARKNEEVVNSDDELDLDEDHFNDTDDDL
ncbi:hypothetical protein Q1695_014748 [Nippostrongylus brasiliensis]|nr:hypothetical protein Q1695_014748 [Nippostrongylus brasiliensis]